MRTGRHISWGAGLPQVFDSGKVDTALVGEFARRSETLGYDSLWVADMHLRPYSVLDPVVLLAYVAALTSRVRLGTSVLISPVYNPILLARELASLDQMSGGRLIVGVGLGTAERLYPRYGISTARAVGRYLEGLRLINALWTTSPTTFRGRYWNTDQVLMEPKPFQQPRPPLWFGGGHPSALRRAVGHADGWMGAGISNTEAFAGNVQLLRRYCEDSGRDPAAFVIAKRIYVGLDRNEARAKRRAGEWLARVYEGFSLDEGTVVSGGVQECVDRVAEVAGLQPDMLLLHPVFDETDQIEALAEDVIPAI